MTKISQQVKFEGKQVKAVLADINRRSGKATFEEVEHIAKAFEKGEATEPQIGALLGFLYNNGNDRALIALENHKDKFSEILKVINPLNGEVASERSGTSALIARLTERLRPLNLSNMNSLEDEITQYVAEVKSGSASDTQVAVVLALICRVKLSPAEGAALTTAMANSGEIIKCWADDTRWIDKHSSGGVGDKITLVVTPILSALGLLMPKMSGPGLGHTGGTTDKLESIPGVTTKISYEDFIKIVDENGCAVISSSKDLAPVDKKTYGLRDVTGTVKNIPLIAASILSKKFAGGAPNFVLDIKYGKGAFMENVEEAIELAECMKAMADVAGKHSTFVISSMESPLGLTSGNANEVEEAIEVLKGEGPTDVRDLSITIAVEALRLIEPEPTDSELRARVEGVLLNGKALDAFKKMTLAQSNDQEATIKFWDNPNIYFSAKSSLPIYALESGYINVIDPLKIAWAGIGIGSGRNIETDVISPIAGVRLTKKVGDFVTSGEIIAYLEYDREDSRSNDANLHTSCTMVENAFTLGNQQVNAAQLIAKIIR